MQAPNLSASPRSLEFARTPPAPTPAADQGLLSKVFLRLGGFYSKESTLMRAANGLYDSVTEQALDPRLLDALEVPSDFQHQHAMLSLHVWLLLVRLRAEGEDGKRLAQMMYDNFQDDVEGRARTAGVKVRLQKQLTELEKQFYGSCMAYDKAIKGEGTESLAAALQRNVFQAAPGAAAAAGKLERYLRRELACLSLTDSAAVMAGNVRFSFADDSKR